MERAAGTRWSSTGITSTTCTTDIGMPRTARTTTSTDSTSTEGLTTVTTAATTGALRSTRQRAAVSALLAETDDFRTAQELHDLLRHRGESVGLTTVYRTLQALADAGEIDVLRTDEGEA